ncbi:porin [Chitinimonas koreensis]|uniref:porin n=1 Tax=Chitinimonas koreensis TaxID=356302 RepID=UPI0003FEB9A9|nr:porin [Chitinimonas koreensis]
MKQLMLVAAVAAALPGLALADGTSVEIYGAIGVMTERVEARGATDASKDQSARLRVSDMSSRIGFRGREDLGDGLWAIWQIEQATRVDDAASAAWASRNSFVGLKGGFGTVRLGRYDMPYKEIGGDLDVMTTAQFSPINGTYSRFEQRAGNLVQYESPAFGGVKLRLAYQPDENKGTLNQQTLDGAVEYAAGGLNLAAAVERRDDVRAVIDSGAAAGDRSTGYKLTAQYATGAWYVGGGLERIESKPNAGAKLRQDGWMLAATYLVAPATRLMASYSSVGELDGKAAAADYKANQASLGATYDFSKRTRGYLFYTRIDNSAAQKLNFSFGSLAGVAAGADPTSFGVGLRHKF